MKLQKVKAREYKGKPIFKYIIVIPPRDVETLGWKHGDELIGSPLKESGYFITQSK
jgi:hypothetical protein